MKLYLLRRNDSVSYWDEYDAAVVAADSPSTARLLAQIELGDAGSEHEPWKDIRTDVTDLGEAAFDVESGVILAHDVRG